MKELTEININDRLVDAIVDYYMNEVKVDGEYCYSDKENNIALHKGKVHKIIFHCKVKGRLHIPVVINAYSIKKLHAIIMEIEAKETQEPIDN